ncbi:MAG: DsbA family protein [Pseudomonadota bacterium]
MNTKIAIGAALAGAVVLGAVIAGWSSAQPAGVDKAPAPIDRAANFSADEEGEIREIVRAYLLENPEVIIEAVNAYSMRQRLEADARARDTAQENLAALINAETGFAAGDAGSAKVAVIEMFDYQCGHCKRAAGVVKSLADDDKDVMVVFRELPIFGGDSEYAAEIALAAREQDKFLDMHFALMDAKGSLTADRVKKIAKKKGLDLAKLEKDRADKSVSAAIEANHRLAQDMGVEGTPAFIIAALDGSYVDVMAGYHRETLMGKISEAKKAANGENVPAP